MLPESIISFLSESARAARTTIPDEHTSLFTSGLLDSFSLVEFVSLIESECGIRVSDSELKPENFDTIARIETFIERARMKEVA